MDNFAYRVVDVTLAFSVLALIAILTLENLA